MIIGGANTKTETENAKLSRDRDIYPTNIDELSVLYRSIVSCRCNTTDLWKIDGTAIAVFHLKKNSTRLQTILSYMRANDFNVRRVRVIFDTLAPVQIFSPGQKKMFFSFAICNGG